MAWRSICGMAYCARFGVRTLYLSDAVFSHDTLVLSFIISYLYSLSLSISKNNINDGIIWFRITLRDIFMRFVARGAHKDGLFIMRTSRVNASWRNAAIYFHVCLCFARLVRVRFIIICALLRARTHLARARFLILPHCCVAYISPRTCPASYLVLCIAIPLYASFIFPTTHPRACHAVRCAFTLILLHPARYSFAPLSLAWRGAACRAYSLLLSRSSLLIRFSLCCFVLL